MSSFIPNRQASEFRPRIVSSDSSHMRQEIASSVLPKGASLALPSSFHQRTASGFFGGNMPMGVSPFGQGGGGGASMYHMQRPYLPGVESPDRVQYPRTREEANRAWRLFHETDPIFGTAMDMYAEMLVSDFDITVGDEKSREIRDTLEYMCQVTNLMDRLRYIIREYLVMGEAIPHCWTPEQLVFTSVGFKRIDTLTEGDLVLTHERRFRPVTEVHIRDYSGEVLNFGIEGASALPCRCTPEHPLYVWTEEGPVWKRAKDVTIQDHIAVGVDKDVEDVVDFDISDVVPEYFDLLIENDKHNGHTGREAVPDIVKVDEDFMRLVGYYYSEGNSFVTTRKGRLTFSFHIDETSYHEDVARILKDKFGVECRFDKKPDTHTCQVHVDSKIVAGFFLNLFGTGCKDKLVPSWLRKLPVHKQKSFLTGLFRGDGNLYYNEQNTFTTAQVQLAHEGITHLAWQMLLRMDVAASFNIFSRARYGSYWKCSFNASMYPELAEEIFEKKVEFSPVVRKHAQIRHSSLFYRVRSIECEEYEGSVYNLEVAEDHSYVVGGIVSHNCFFDDSLGIWTYIAMHNPDFIEVLDSPIVNMDPIISFIPDESLRAMMSAGTPEAREFRSRLPADFVSRILARQKIRLSPLNCTFIPRKLHPYQTRGTSLASRMWRIFMVEDAVYNSTIATFRRHASPVKVLKLGDPATGWIPAPGAETKLLEMLNRAEVDPHSWLIYHYGINFEAWGTTDRAITIGKEHDVIERVKLLALGLSKSFMTGEVTYASAKSGLQVFLRRLLSLRQLLENLWIYPKFFRPISEINEWTTAAKSEVNHKYRIKRTAQEIQEQNLIMVPTLKWKNKLDPTVDTDVLAAYQILEKFGVKLSKATISSAVGIDWQDELDKSLKEFKAEKKQKTDVLGETELAQYEQEYGKGAQQQPGGAPPGAPGTPGAGAKPPAASGKPPGAMGGPGGAPGMNDASNPPGSAEPTMPGALGGGIEAPSGGGLPGGGGA